MTMHWHEDGGRDDECGPELNDLDKRLLDYLTEVIPFGGMGAAIAASGMYAGMKLAFEHPEWAAAYLAQSSAPMPTIADHVVQHVPITLEQEPQQ